MDTFEKRRFNTLRKNNLIRQYKTLMYVLGPAYAAFGILFYLFQQKFFEFLEYLPTTYVAHPLPASHFLSVVVLGLSINLAIVCVSSALNPQIWSFQWLHLLTKLTTGGLFLFLFFKDQPYWLYLVSGVVDAAISLILVVMLFRFMILRPYKDDRPAYTSRPPSSGIQSSTMGTREPAFPQSPSGQRSDPEFRSRSLSADANFV